MVRARVGCCAETTAACEQPLPTGRVHGLNSGCRPSCCVSSAPLPIPTPSQCAFVTTPTTPALHSSAAAACARLKQHAIVVFVSTCARAALPQQSMPFSMTRTTAVQWRLRLWWQSQTAGVAQCGPPAVCLTLWWQSQAAGVVLHVVRTLQQLPPPHQNTQTSQTPGGGGWRVRR